MSTEDQQLVEQAIAGDRLAFRTLVLKLSPDMFRLACRFTGDAAAAEDVVQEAFIKAYEKLPTFKRDASVRTWIHRITVNTAMDHLRREKTRDRYERAAADLVDDAITERPADGQEILRHTQSAMAKLTEVERAALTLRHFEGHSIAEIAATLDLNPNACKQAVFRAVRKLRVALEPLVATP
ncbi:MAG: RNA polymerase sigma factor [Pseudomonadota bacterium]